VIEPLPKMHNKCPTENTSAPPKGLGYRCEKLIAPW
jgi:hypothetical protein